ncbi:MAG: FAD-binding protein [Azospirillum sp.]|nr:FAD-binding protein [Azospirillum sp.]
MSEAALQRLRDAVGPKGWIAEPTEMAPYLTEWRGRFRGAAPLVVRPSSTAEVAAVVGICAEAGLAVVPQGGNTSLVGGSIPFEHGTEVVLCLSRMNRIRDLDPLNYTMTVDAGCILATLQDAADAADRRFPLAFGADGTAQIGGAIASNAGGMLTVRYGNTRDLVLGIEAVLPDGRVWNGLRRLRKDNTGYDLKQLLIGSEGTLGVITAAVVKLFPKPRQVESAFLAVADPSAAIALLAALRAATGDGVAVFELIPRLGLDFALAHVEGVIDPLADRHDWYVLTEVAAGTVNDQFRETFETALGEAMEQGLVLDAVIAASQAQASAFWLIREAIVEAQKHEGGSLKNDIAVPVSKVAEFITRATAAVEALIPGVRVIAFGHVGDGNIHFNMNQPEGADTAGFMARWDEIQTAVNDIVLALDGSISAEHGIGRIKRQELQRMKSPLEIELMHRIKRAFDPEGLMNPGKLLP